MKEIFIIKEPVGIVKTGGDIFIKIKKLNIEYDQENGVVIYLNCKMRIIKSEVLFKGGANSAIIDPKTLFRRALQNNAYYLIVAHNHPSGDLTPSPEDIESYDNLESGGALLGLKVLDSVIFNKNDFYSLNKKR